MATAAMALAPDYEAAVAAYGRQSLADRGGLFNQKGDAMALISYEEIEERLGKMVEWIDAHRWNLGQLKAGIASLAEDVKAVREHLDRKTPNWKTMERPILSVDFDGVIRDPKCDEWIINKINDPPVHGAFEWLKEALDHFTVVIFSSRCNHPAGIATMKEWFLDHGMAPWVLNQFIFEPGKPSWFVHVDDRAICFNGTFIAPGALARAFKPWYYGIPGYRPQEGDKPWQSKS